MLVGAFCVRVKMKNVDLLLHCKAATRLWRVALNLFGMKWVMVGTLKEAVQSWIHR